MFQRAVKDRKGAADFSRTLSAAGEHQYSSSSKAPVFVEKEKEGSVSKTCASACG